MKSVPTIQLVDRQAPLIQLDDQVVSSLRLTEGTVLNGVLLVRHPDKKGTLDGRAESMLIASPLPVWAWGRLLRVGITLTAGIGRLSAVVSKLEALRLYLRHIECLDALPVTNYAIINQIDALATLLDDDHRSIQPTTIITVEVPIESRSTTPLHVACRSLTTAGQDSSSSTPSEADASLACRHALQQAIGDIATIDWVSPLRSLNKLAHKYRFADSTTRPSGLHSGEALVTAERTVTVERARSGTGLTFRLHAAWEAELDIERKRLIARNRLYEGSMFETSSLASVTSCDSDERVVIVQFISLHANTLASFTLDCPSRGDEGRWWQWVLEEIHDTRGNVLSAHSTARQEGRWAGLTVVAAFPFASSADDASERSSGVLGAVGHAARRLPTTTGPSAYQVDFEKVSKILACFRRLGNARKATTSMAPPARPDKSPLHRLIADLKGSYRTTRLEDTLGDFGTTIANEREPQFDSDVHSVKLWYRWPGDPGPEYRQRFTPNPFDFTRPLSTVDDYRRLYGIPADAHADTRLRLSARIAERLLDSKDGNIILIGTHRSGKTSIMNTVCDMLRHPEEWTHFYPLKGWEVLQDLDRVVVVVRINAATTPPYRLLSEIMRQLQIDETSSTQGGSAEPSARARTLSRFQQALKQGHEAMAATLKAMGVAQLLRTTGLEHGTAEFAAGMFAETVLRGEHKSPPDTAIQNSQGSRPLAHEVLDMAIRSISDAMHEVDAASQSESSRLADASLGTVRIVIALDELADSTRWGGQHAYAALRHVIESPEYRRIAWLFCSSYPVAAAAGYSPLTNALQEINLDPLSHNEVRVLLSHFGRVAEDGRLSPVLTSDAKIFISRVTGRYPYLLQVCCSHIYEQTIRKHIPLVSRRLAYRIVVRKVLPELSDYFAALWAELSQQEQTALRAAVPENWDALGRVTPPKSGIRVPAILAKKLDRLGLSAESSSLVPLFAQWIVARVPLAVSSRGVSTVESSDSVQ